MSKKKLTFLNLFPMNCRMCLELDLTDPEGVTVIVDEGAMNLALVMFPEEWDAWIVAIVKEAESLMNEMQFERFTECEGKNIRFKAPEY